MNAENRIKRIQPPFDYNTVCPTFSVILFAHTRNRCPPSPLFRDGVLAIGGASRISGTFPPDRTRRFRKTVIIPLFVTAVFQAKEVDTIRIWSNLKSDGFRAPLLLWPFVRRTRLPSSYETNPLGERFFFQMTFIFSVLPLSAAGPRRRLRRRRRTGVTRVTHLSESTVCGSRPWRGHGRRKPTDCYLRFAGTTDGRRQSNKVNAWSTRTLFETALCCRRREAATAANPNRRACWRGFARWQYCTSAYSLWVCHVSNVKETRKSRFGFTLGKHTISTPDW